MTKNKDLANFEAPQPKARKNLRVGNLPKKTIKALEESRMDQRHTSLDELVQD
jgi:hypothetical protein